VFLQQELQFCNVNDTDSQSSLSQAIQSFNDALRSLEAVQDAGYKIAESHRTRIQNILRVPGMNMTEKAVYQQRLANMTAAQNSYLALQKEALK
jgi:hypothetical protein